MMFAILRSTPAGVWLLLAGLVAFGLTQLRPRELGFRRLRVVPLVMVALSAFGIGQAFGLAPLAFAAWAAGLAAAFGAGVRLSGVDGVRPGRRPDTLHVPGSALPLVLMLGLFSVKYVIGVSLALHPAIGADGVFMAACGAACGSFAGGFLARSVAIRRALTGSPGVALRTAPAGA